MAFERGEAQAVAIVCYDGEVPTDPTNPVATVSTDGGAFAAADNAPAVIAGSGKLYLTLSAAEMTGDLVTVHVASDNLEVQSATYYTEGDWTKPRAERIDDLALEATLTAMKGAGWTDETLVAIKAVLDAVTGDGAYTVTFTVSDGAGTLASGLKTQIEDASGNLVAGPITTNSSGQRIYYLDEGTYYFVTPSTSVWQGNSEEVTVSADASVAVTLTAQNIPAPPTSDYCVVTAYENSVANNVATSGKLKVTHVHSPDTDGSGATTSTVTWDDQDEANLNAAGVASLSLLRGAVVDLELQLTGAKNVKRTRRVVPDEDTKNWEQMEQQDA